MHVGGRFSVCVRRATRMWGGSTNMALAVCASSQGAGRRSRGRRGRTGASPASVVVLAVVVVAACVGVQMASVAAAATPFTCASKHECYGYPCDTATGVCDCGRMWERPDCVLNFIDKLPDGACVHPPPPRPLSGALCTVGG